MEGWQGSPLGAGGGRRAASPPQRDVLVAASLQGPLPERLRAVTPEGCQGPVGQNHLKGRGASP